MVPRGWGLLTLVIPWLFIWSHHEVKVFTYSVKMSWHLPDGWNLVTFMVPRGSCDFSSLAPPNVVTPWELLDWFLHVAIQSPQRINSNDLVHHLTKFWIVQYFGLLTNTSKYLIITANWHLVSNTVVPSGWLALLFPFVLGLTKLNSLFRGIAAVVLHLQWWNHSTLTDRPSSVPIRYAGFQLNHKVTGAPLSFTQCDLIGCWHFDKYGIYYMRQITWNKHFITSPSLKSAIDR